MAKRKRKKAGCNGFKVNSCVPDNGVLASTKPSTNEKFKQFIGKNKKG